MVRHNQTPLHHYLDPAMQQGGDELQREFPGAAEVQRLAAV